MKLEPDMRHLAQINAYQNERRSAPWWITVIVIGVFLGNVVSFGAYQMYVKWELHRLASKTKTDMERFAEKNAAMMKERAKTQAVKAQLLQTCDFWRQQVAKENTEQNRVYRDAACARPAEQD